MHVEVDVLRAETRGTADAKRGAERFWFVMCRKYIILAQLCLLGRGHAGGHRASDTHGKREFRTQSTANSAPIGRHRRTPSSPKRESRT